MRKKQQPFGCSIMIALAVLFCIFISESAKDKNNPQSDYSASNSATTEAAVEPEKEKTGEPEEKSNNAGTSADGILSADMQLAQPAQSPNLDEQIIHHYAYTVSYNNTLHDPNWVCWCLTSDHTDGPYKRKGTKFMPDDEVKGAKVDTYDYMRSGYDRGHMCPSGDNRWSSVAQYESFYMSNICPQIHNLNAGDWKEMEEQCRLWAEKYGKIYIVAGPLFYRSSHRYIGSNDVAVPEGFFKVVLCTAGKPKAIGFVYHNTPGNHPKSYYANSVDEVERITGFDFFPSLPDKTERQVESHYDFYAW